ncbi:MAG: calcium-binding protein [Pseudomonadota bacterium]
MTTYTITGTRVTFDQSDNISGIIPVQMSFVHLGDSDPVFRYGILQEYPDFFPDIAIVESGLEEIRVTGLGIIEGSGGFNRFLEVGQFLYQGRLSYTIQVNSSDPLFGDSFLLGGAEWPPLTTEAQILAFVSQSSAFATASAASGFGPDTDISLTALANVVVTENDTFMLDSQLAKDAGVGDDTAIYSNGTRIVEGGVGFDSIIIDRGGLPNMFTDIALVEGGVRMVFTAETNTLTATGFEQFEIGAETYTFDELRLLASNDPVDLVGDEGDNLLVGDTGDDRLVGLGGDDTLEGGDGRDVLNGGDGDDLILAGATSDDLRDTVFAGAGDDSVNGGAGNDLLYGMDGNDTIDGGFGVDEIQGQAGDDVLSGSAFSDVIFGGDGADFINGGFGFDRMNGGDGADRFYHLGTAGHASDWVQDYTAADGDILLFGMAGVSADDFQLNLAFTPNAGDAGVAEGFVIYKPTQQIVWALVDGGGQDVLNLQIAGSGEIFDLTA